MAFRSFPILCMLNFGASIKMYIAPLRMLFKYLSIAIAFFTELVWR